MFKKDKEPRCAYCEYGKPLVSGEILCPKKGIMKPEESCRRFVYDPFKRVPEKTPELALAGLKEEDFKLE